MGAPFSWRAAWRMSTTRTTGIFLSSARVGISSRRYLPLRALIVTLHRGRSGAEHDDGAFHASAHDRHVARLIARRFLLFVGILVFLIDNDQSQRVHRREHGGARADDNPGAALANLVPFIVPFARRKMAVQHRHQRSRRAGAETRLESFDGLGRQRNLRHQDNRAFSLLQGAAMACK